MNQLLIKLMRRSNLMADFVNAHNSIGLPTDTYIYKHLELITYFNEFDLLYSLNRHLKAQIAFKYGIEKKRRTYDLRYSFQ